MKNNIIAWLFSIMTMSHWLRNYPYNSSFDKKLNELLEANTMFTDIDNYSANFGNYKLWIENYPYASFRLYEDFPRFLPKRYTVYLLRKRLEESILLKQDNKSL